MSREDAKNRTNEPAKAHGEDGSEKHARSVEMMNHVAENIESVTEVDSERLKSDLERSQQATIKKLVKEADEELASAMDEESQEEVEEEASAATEKPDDACAVCGRHVEPTLRRKISGGGYICRDCHHKMSGVVTSKRLTKMTPRQIRKHIDAMGELGARYRDSFKATTEFKAGNKDKHVVLAIDETHDWWALPETERPAAFSLDSIVDCKMEVKTMPITGDPTSTISTNVLLDTIRMILRSIITFFTRNSYRTPYSDLPDIPKGEQPVEMRLLLTLDEDESGLKEASLNLCPSKVVTPQNVRKAYERAHQIIEYFSARQDRIFEQYSIEATWDNSEESPWLRKVAALEDVAADDLEFMRYYTTRQHGRAYTSDEELGFRERFSLVQGCADSVASNLCAGNRAPKWKTQRDADYRVFVSAFLRYAANIRFSDVIYIRDDTNIHSGKDGMLLTVDGFAVDAPEARRSKGPDAIKMPIRYDELLCVLQRERKRLVLVYRDGSRKDITVPGGYRHYLFATLNCILSLMP